MPQDVQLKRSLPATQQEMVASDLALMAKTDPTDGKIIGDGEAYFAEAALSGLRDFRTKYGSVDLSFTMLMLRFTVGVSTSTGIRLSTQDTSMLKEMMPDYLAHLRKQTKDPCVIFHLKSAQYLYGELQQAKGKGLYASMYTQKFDPAKATKEAQAWLRDNGYLWPKEGIKSLIGGRVIHFSPPAEGKPMLVVYSDQSPMNRFVQEGIYMDFLKWHQHGVKHILLQEEELGTFGHRHPLKKEVCGGRNMTDPPMKIYCAFDDVTLCGVDDMAAWDLDPICHAKYPPLTTINRRNRVMVENIGITPRLLNHKIAMMQVGAGHVQHYIRELPKKGMGLMVIEMPQVTEFLHRVEKATLELQKLEAESRHKEYDQKVRELIGYLESQRIGP